jgi:hypothetical protein
MNDIIDLNAYKNAKSQPESSCVYVDVEDGQPVKYFKFFGTYEFGGKEWLVQVWATDQQQAQEKMAALGSVKYEGQIFAEVPA